MRKWTVPFFAHLFLLLTQFIFVTSVFATQQTKIAIFTFNTKNLEASGYGTTVTNQLSNHLETFSGLAILDRKELESFLSLNDLQQNDDLKNITYIGGRQGLDIIIAGNVTKRGPTITVDCKVVKIDEKKSILHKRLKVLGSAALARETKKLAGLIHRRITKSFGKAGTLKGKKAEANSPKNVITRSGKSKIALYWEPAPQFKAAGFKVFRAESESGPFIRLGQTAEPNYTDKSVESKIIYFYKIKAYDKRGRESNFSKVFSAKTAITLEPPIILNTDAHVKSIRVVWAPNPLRNPEAGKIKWYRLYQARDEGGPYKKVAEIDPTVSSSAFAKLGIKSEIDSISQLDEGLGDGDRRFYKVSAYSDKDLESDFSKPIMGTSIPIVSGVSALGEMIREIRLKWDTAKSEHVEGYHIYRKRSEKEDFSKIETISGREVGTFSDKKDLADNTTYYYQVTLFEDGGRETSGSSIVSAKTRDAPPVLTGLEAVGNLVKRVKLQWNISPQEEVKGYKIYRSTQESGPYELIATVKGRTNAIYVDSGAFMKALGDYRTYHYRVVTYNKVDVESKSWAYGSARTKPRPEKPAELRGVVLQVKNVPLSWHSNKEKDIANYIVYRKTANAVDFSKVGETGNNTSYTDTGLSDGTEYVYRIKAEDKDGLISDFSEPARVSTKPKPKKIIGLKARYEKGQAVLTWNANSEADITHYNVFEKSFFGFKKVGTASAAEIRVKGPASGKSSEYAVTAVDGDGLESEPSQIITVLGR